MSSWRLSLSNHHTQLNGAPYLYRSKRYTMALPPKEIRYKKHVLYPFLFLGLILFGVSTWLLLFSGQVHPNALAYITMLGPFVIIGFVFWQLFKRTQSDEPALTFASEGLTVHRKKPVFIPWSTITEWKTRRDKSNDTLIIRTHKGKERISLAFLDASTANIRWLMETYIKQPGPHSVPRSDY